MDVPRSYERLLRTYPEWWRRAYGEVVLSTLLEVHAAAGRRRPSLGDGVRFALSGLRHRLPGRTGAPSRPITAAAEPWHLFDQLNAVVEVPGEGEPGATRDERHRRVTESLSQASAVVTWGKQHF